MEDSFSKLQNDFRVDMQGIALDLIAKWPDTQRVRHILQNS